MDAFFLDGACVIFRIALAILRENEQKIIDCRDEGEIMLLLSGFMESVYSREAPQGTSKILHYVTSVLHNGLFELVKLKIFKLHQRTC